MAGLREIQNRIRSIQDTRKITNAMYLISSTKLKKARKELAETEPYFYALQNVIRRIQRHLPNMESPYFEKEGHQSKKTGLLVISGDKGLAGAYNHNIMKMVATKNYAEYVKTAVKAGADLIISGAGLPVSLPEYVKGTATKIAPIVSSVKAATVICRMWDRKYQTAPDLVVVEGPLAGGHLGFDREKLTELEVDTPHAAETFHQAEYDEEVRGIIALVKKYAQKYGKSIPVVTAGGIYDHADVMHQMELGADGVQVATRFVTTEECDAPMAYKQAYLDAKEEDIVIVKSPVGMPGRAIKNAFLKELEKGRQAVTHCYQCLEHCDPAKIPYCITQALVNAARGDEDHALIFCGGNAWRAEKIETVEGVMRALCEG